MGIHGIPYIWFETSKYIKGSNPVKMASVLLPCVHVVIIFCLFRLIHYLVSSREKKEVEEVEEKTKKDGEVHTMVVVCGNSEVDSAMSQVGKNSSTKPC